MRVYRKRVQNRDQERRNLRKDLIRPFPAGLGGVVVLAKEHKLVGIVQSKLENMGLRLALDVV